MQKNAGQLPNQMEMSIFTFTHDYYLLELPNSPSFYAQFPLYRNNLDFKGQQIRSAPIVRIYGTNDYSEKCCCHVHGFFPFLYIKADQYENAFKDNLFLIDFLNKLETIYQQSFKTSKPIIYRGELQYKLDFYGYHTQKQAFLRIYLFDPLYTTRMRELLSSNIISNKSFQCYEAHINYYMQFFSEFNIYGINEMKICGFTFRKNYKIMPLFEKISSRLMEGIVHRGWDLADLEQTRPECFNGLYKTSTCYIELDFQFQSILNSYELRESDEEEIHSSDEEIMVETNGLRKLKVTVTKALEQIWRDERKRRIRLKIRQPLEGLIDLTKNIECMQDVEKGLKDPLWINFLEKGDNGPLFVNMLQSYLASPPSEPGKEITVDYLRCRHYQQMMSNQRQELINNVHNRFRFYQNRKNKIIDDIMSGDLGELPQWSDEQQESQMDSQNSDDSVISKAKSENPDSRSNPVGNTVKYRNNFKFQLASFKAGSLFSDCKTCRMRTIECNCEFCLFCGQVCCDCNKLQLLQKMMAYKKLGEEMVSEFQYDKDPPSVRIVKEQRVVEHQRPFYSKLDDLYSHYKISSTISVQEKYAQYIDKQLKNTSFFNREPITIKNHKKLPYFYNFQQQKQSFTQCLYELQFMKDPPKRETITGIPKKQKQQKKIRGSTNKFEDTFVADLLVFNYELLLQIPESHLFYGNPEKHQISGIVFDLYNQQSPSQSIKGAILQRKYAKNVRSVNHFDEIFLVNDERGILSMLINIVFRVDVDIFISWDMEKKGIRYLLERGIVNNINIASCLSRTNDLQDLFQHINFIDYQSIKETYLKREYLTHGNIIEAAAQRPSKDHAYYLNILQEKLKKRLTKKPILRQKYLFDVEIKGRVNINLHRICEMELKLRSYTLQAVVSHIYQTQSPDFTDKYLCDSLLQIGNDVLAYVAQKIEYQKLITHEINVIGGVVEKSKIYGADFLSMMERGSQFKIESIMCRTAKQNEYLTLSATKKQVANQSLLLCRPLVIEPPKQFYSEPVLLFDFQSLYPSVMIAYNLCYSTCLGSIKELFKQGKMKRIGVSNEMTMHLEKLCSFVGTEQSEEEIIRALANYVFVSPNKVAFVKKTLKEGIIPKILLQFLISRIMIKNSSKLYHKDSIKNILKERQLALKLFMNVMFGYTGATFSGRMPCSQIADSVVEVSKYCLRKSIDYLNNNPTYKGKVLYGDTDSIFFHLPNHQLKQTFEIGKKLAQQITKMFPYPMEMKFEKVYQSLFLVSKKRYYGKSYETAEGLPKYEGKGIQTVRRDGLNFTSQSMRNIFNNLMDSKDLSGMKQQIYEESRKLITGVVGLSDLCQAKEVKLLKYNPKYIPAHGQAAKRLQRIDPMLLPKYGQRLKYLIVEGKDGIKNRSIPLFEFMLNKGQYQLDYAYYYTKLYLPPLRRTLISLVNIDEWGLVNQYSKEKQCNEEHLHNGNSDEIICSLCLQQELQKIKKEKGNFEKICSQCTSSARLNYQDCKEWNCENLYRRKTANDIWKRAQEKGAQMKITKELLNC